MSQSAGIANAKADCRPGQRRQEGGEVPVQRCGIQPWRCSSDLEQMVHDLANFGRIAG